MASNQEDDIPYEENYVDVAKLKARQLASSSDNFYGHGIDPASARVRNVYDSREVQNTIGTKGRVLKDHGVDSKDVVYSNERTYGKTGWNGQFVYETPVQPKKK